MDHYKEERIEFADDYEEMTEEEREQMEAETAEASLAADLEAAEMAELDRLYRKAMQSQEFERACEMADIFSSKEPF